MSAIGGARRLARLDLTRTRRKYLGPDRKASHLFGLLAYAVVFLLLTGGGGYGAYLLGRALAGGELGIAPADAAAIARGLVALFGLVAAVVLVVRAVGQRGTLENAEGTLTTVTTGSALVGVLFAEFAFVLLWVLVPGVAAGVGLAVGAGTLWSVATVPLAVVAVAATAVAVGYPLGLGIRHAVTRFAFVARHKVALIVAVFVAYFAAVSSGSLNAVMVALFEPMQASPTGWAADLLLLWVPGVAASPLLAAGALGATAALGVAAAAVGTALADRHWFSDPALAGAEEEAPTGSAERGLETALAPYLGTATAALVVLAWRRAYRAPLKLLYAAYPLLFLVGVFAEIVQTGVVPAYLPFAVLVFVAYAAGVVFTLNPLGDQGAVLPATVLSRVDGRTFARAHLLASLIVAVPLGMALTAVAAVLSPIDAETTVALVAAVPLVMVVSAALSVGIGVAFPRFEAVNVTRSMKTVVPSVLGFVLFSLHLLVTVAAGAVVYEPLVRLALAGLLTWILPFGLAVSPETLYYVAAVAIVALVLAPLASYRYAVRTYDRYTLD
jgi:hypothetical protein